MKKLKEGLKYGFRNNVLEARCKYIADDVKLPSIPLVRKYLVSGDASKVTGRKSWLLFSYRYQKLNPYLREAYLIKYEVKPRCSRRISLSEPPEIRSAGVGMPE